MMAKPIQMLAVALVPQYLCVFLVLGKLGRGRVIRLPLIERRPNCSQVTYGAVKEQLIFHEMMQ
jgi:hypothetical protein